MKKQILLFTLSAGMVAAVLMSSSGGAVSTAGNRTGAKGTSTSCAGGSCHGAASAAASATIRVDSAGGVAVTKYVPGMTYTVTVTGSHTSHTRFGFQFAAVSGIGGAQLQAGTFSSLPANVTSTSASALNIIEQSSPINAVSPADSFIRSFSWTAPAAGLGNISLYLIINAVNGNSSPDAGDVTASTSKVLTELVTASVPVVANRATVTAFPNPAVGQLNVQVGNIAAAYTVTVYDVMGRSVASTTVEAGNIAATTSFNTSTWAQGAYQVVVESEGNSTVQQIVKQ